MDPNEVLSRAERAYEEGDLEECAEALEAYAEWRANDGFANEGGDERFDQLFMLVINLAQDAPMMEAAR